MHATEGSESEFGYEFPDAPIAHLPGVQEQVEQRKGIRYGARPQTYLACPFVTAP
jgi:hypothetical protein